ncbi:MAG: histidine kinase dimerization/phospho-acceptor domain-containing protein [Burkholderiaceae bacterium]
MAKQNEQLQEYSHVVSHDLKSPLRSINALIAWIKEDSLGALEGQSVANFELIEATLQKMEQLITDILEYSQIDAAHSSFPLQYYWEILRLK